MRSTTLMMLALSLLMTVGCESARRFEEVGAFQTSAETLTSAAALKTATTLIADLPEEAGTEVTVTGEGLSGTLKRTKFSRAQQLSFRWKQVKSVQISRHKKSGLVMVDLLPAPGAVRDRLVRLEMSSVEDARKLSDAVLTLAKK